MGMGLRAAEALAIAARADGALFAATTAALREELADLLRDLARPAP